MDVVTLTVMIWMAIAPRKTGRGTSKLSNLSFKFPGENNDIPIKGEIHFTDTSLRGLDTIKSAFENIEVRDEDEYGNNKVCIKNFKIGNLIIDSKYRADLTILNMPLYGDGNFSLSFEDVQSEVCFYAISHNTSAIQGLEELKILMTFQHKPVSIEGFLRNSEANELLLQLLDLFNVFLAMWHSYEPEGASCFLSPLIQYAVNAHLKYGSNHFIFDPTTCLWKGTPFGDLGKIPYKTLMILVQDILNHIDKN